jgi:hypothetical protein
MYQSLFLPYIANHTSYFHYNNIVEWLLHTLKEVHYKQVTTLFFTEKHNLTKHNLTEKHYATGYESTLLSEWQQSKFVLLLWIQTLNDNIY